MPSNTPNLNLLKKDPATDGNDTFNIKEMLNDNWDKTDAKFGSSTGHGHSGVAGDGPKITASGLAAGAGSDPVIGNRTIADTAAPTGDTSTITTLLGWLANMIKSITGKSSWRTAPATTLEEAKAHADDNTRHLTAAERTTWNAKETTGGAQAKADAVQTNLTAHAGDTTRHLTAAERTAWNAKETPGGAQTKADGAEAAAKAASIPLAQKGAAGGVALLNAESEVVANGAIYGHHYMNDLGRFSFSSANQKIDIFITGHLIGYLDISISGTWYGENAVGNLTKRLSIHTQVSETIDYQDSEYINVNGRIKEHISISDLQWGEVAGKWKVSIEARSADANTFSVFVEGTSPHDTMPTFALGQLYTGSATTLPLAVQSIPDDTVTKSGYKVLNSADTSTFAPAVHEHNYIKSVDKRDVKPNGLVPRSLALYFAEYTSNPNAVNYQDLLVLNGWEDGSGGLVNALRFDKDLKHIEHLQAAPGTTDWGTPSTLAYREDLMSGAIDPGEYITNADTLGKNGFYNVPSSWVGSVFTGTDGANQGYLNHTIWNSSYAMQTFMPVNTADGNKTGLWYRRKTVGEWSGWMRTWGTENDQPIMIMRGIVPPGANLDLYDHPGMYSLTESASYLNGPGLDWAVMVVSRSAVHYVVQEVTGISSAGKRYRTRTESGAWSGWYQCVLRQDLTTAVQSPPYAVTTGTAAALVASISPAPAALSAGLRLSIKTHLATTGPVTLNLNGLGAKSIKKPNGNNPPLVLGGVYTVVYDGTAFILQGEGGEYGTAGAADVLAGKTVGTENGIVNGEIPLRGGESYPGWREATVGIASGVGRIHLAIPKGAYLTGTSDQGGLVGVYKDDPGFNPAYFRSDVNMFGLQGAMPVITAGADPAQGVGLWGDGGLAVYPSEGYRKGGAGAGEIKVSTAQLASVGLSRSASGTQLSASGSISRDQNNYTTDSYLITTLPFIPKIVVITTSTQDIYSLYLSVFPDRITTQRSSLLSKFVISANPISVGTSIIIPAPVSVGVTINWQAWG